MTPVRIKNEQIKYDAEHDVLHIFFPPFVPSVDDEEYPGIIIRRSLIDERITGLVILDFSRRNSKELANILPQYKLNLLKKRYQRARH